VQKVQSSFYYATPSLLETLEILSDKEFMAHLREVIRQAEAGETISLEELKAELGF
jgi:PHD/YefM family antitoxin component YafN of YafNO toxin-antitoxin module